MDQPKDTNSTTGGRGNAEVCAEAFLDGLELCMTSAGRFYLGESDATEVPISVATVQCWHKAFASSNAEGFLALAAYQGIMPLSLTFGRDFVRRYIAVLCHDPSVRESGAPLPIPFNSLPDWDEWLECVAPFYGDEELCSEHLEQIWDELHTVVCEAIEREGFDEFLRSINPEWRAVGRLTLHLAEIKKNPTRPFAFMVTYANRISELGRAQHLPLKRAVAEYAGAHNRAALLRLLEPLHIAMPRSKLIENLVESGRIYEPIAFSIQEAYALLRDIPTLEECGLVVRVPDWWSVRKPPRPVVSVTLGDKKPMGLGAATLLDFNLAVVCDGEELTKEELAAILAAEDGLVSLRGKWVEINRRQLREVLEHWQRIERAVSRDGLSFAQAMRFLSGAAIGTSSDQVDSQAVQAWSGVTAGTWLGSTLTRLRDPSGTTELACAQELHATLRPYQLKGVQWLHFITTLGLGGCLADDMGLGKTIQTLALLLWHKKERAAHKPTLLVVPASLLANWRDEARRFAPTLRLLTLHPSTTPEPLLIKRCEQAPQKGLAAIDLVVTTYGMAPRIKWLAEVDWRLVILDEAQAIKNAQTRQARAVKAFTAEARLALTGTPVENRVGDLWSLFDFINPGLLGGAANFAAFMRTSAKSRDGHAPIRRLTRPYILRRLKTDRTIISDLPDKTIMPTWCGLSRAQSVLYAAQVAQLAKELNSLTGEGIKRRALILTALMRFKQICNHPAQALGDGDYCETRSGKFARLRELCEELAERRDKALIFTQYREMTDPLAAFLSAIFKRSGLVLHGGTPVAQRRKLVETFQRDDGPPFFVLSLKAGGTGLNLTQASHVLHFDRWWNPAVENQATDRAFRIGQKKNVFVHTFVCRGTVEEKIDTMLAEKSALANELLDGSGEKMLTEMSDSELLSFVKLDLAAAGV